MWTEPILCVDMDSFFVEVERLDDPGLRRRPVAVGGKGARGVIASASYEARRFGVHSAQPTTTALRLCPELVMVAPDHHKYGEVSARVFAAFRSFTPLVEGVSLDEAYLDVGGLRRHYDDVVAAAVELKNRIRSEIGLPASIGVAANKLVAKLASEAAKPDGVRHVPVAGQLDFLHPQPVTALPGVGPATMAGLARLGVTTIGDLAEVPEPTLANALGPALGRRLSNMSHGVDLSSVQPDSETKSVSVEETYALDLATPELVETALLAHAHRLSSRLRRSGLAARTILVKVRFPDFETSTRSHTSPAPFDGAREIFRIAMALMTGIDRSRPVRLLGLGASGLESRSEPRQLGLDGSTGWGRVEDALAEIRDRYGDSAVTAMRLVEEDER